MDGTVQELDGGEWMAETVRRDFKGYQLLIDGNPATAMNQKFVYVQKS